MRYFERFEEGQLFTFWEFPITIFIDDQENLACYVGDTDITDELTQGEATDMLEAWREVKQQQIKDDEADRADWEYEQHRDRLLDKAGSVE